MQGPVLRLGSPGFVGATLVLLLGCGHPSDADLIERFRDKRSEFESLVRMAREDAETVGTITPRYLSPSGALSNDRWAEYRSLFEELDLEGGLNTGTSTVEIFASVRGFAFGGSDKGYLYSDRPPGKLYDSLDDMPGHTESLVPSYRRIDENWYLYYMWDD